MFGDPKHFQHLQTGALNFHRMALFGSLPMQIFDQSPSGDVPLISLAVDWAGHHEKPNKEIPTDHWIFLIYDRAELTIRITSPMHFIVIGSQKWEIEKKETPTGNLGCWRIVAQIIKPN